MKIIGISMRAGLMASVASGSLLLSGGAACAQRATEINIGPQDLSTALYEFGIQADRQVMFAPGVTAAKKTSGVAAASDEQLALAQLLKGTGLTYRMERDVFVIVQEGGSVPQSGSAAGDGADGTVEALIVTAQKREEDIQDVPIAISAFSQEALERSQIAGGPDLITQVPNMTFTKTNFSSYSIQIRGIGTQAISATTDAAVAVAFNNTPFIRNRFFEQEFYDLQRVEVLRGPQGTLYGRNATAGVVNIISAKPRFNYEAKLSGDLSNYNSTRVEGMINIPLVEDKAALRLAGAWTKRDGYATNELSGNPIDGRDLWSTRLSLRMAPSDAIDVNLIWEHFEENDDRLRSGKQLCKKHVREFVGDVPVDIDTELPGAGLHFAFLRVQGVLNQGCVRTSLYSPEAYQTPNGAMVPYYLPLGALALPYTFFDPYQSQTQSRDLRVIESIRDPDYQAKSDLGELQISWDVTDNLTLTSETAYNSDFVWSFQDFNRFNTIRGAFNPDDNLHNGPADTLDDEGFFCDPQLGCSDRLVAMDLANSKSRQFSQEFRVGSDFDGSFNFSLGANFLRFDGEDKYYVFINSVTLTSINIAGPATVPWEPGVTENLSCLTSGPLLGSFNRGLFLGCPYIDPNPISSLNDQGHNYFLSKNPYKLISYAVFGETYYNITDNLKLTAGLRWTVDQKEAPRIPSWTFGGYRGYPVLEVIEQEWREPTGRLAIDWKPDLAFTDETLIYGSYAHGYKAGGANPPPMIMIGNEGGIPTASATRPKIFDAEFVDAFELGAKNTLLDGKVTLNLAGFFYDYTGYQISEIVDRSAFNRNVDATVWGVELEADWRPLENLRFGLKIGHENTRIADGQEAIDLMDRTYGHDDWIVVRPFPAYASSCVLPVYVFTPVTSTGEHGLTGLHQVGGSTLTACERAYQAGLDPVTMRPYKAFPEPGEESSGGVLYKWQPGTYQGFDPFDESQGHNFGEGFMKPLGGNELPNAPNWTATLTGDYTLPLPNEWLATLHADLYWQSDSWWRIFNDHEFNKLDEYFTMNVAAIFTNEDAGWRVMAYVKNVFDRDSITGAFLNSDDTALTTNVFLTEPRLYGLRVTKNWRGGPLWGSFGSRHEGPYPFEVEIGGQVQRHDAPNDSVTPTFMDEFSQGVNPLSEQAKDLDWGDGREVKVSWRPADTWKVSLGARYGKTNGSSPWAQRVEEQDRACAYPIAYCEAGQEYITRDTYTISTTTEREAHTIIDFAVGKDIGIGILSRSGVSAGLRHTRLESEADARIFGQTNWDIPVDENTLFDKYADPTTHDAFEARLAAQREFKGLGPTLSWDASRVLLGNADTGTLGLDWSVTGGVLFGKQKVSITGTETERNFSEDTKYLNGHSPSERMPDLTTLTPVKIERSDDVTVPVFGATLGLFYSVDRLSVGAGYRWERYQDAIDGGMDAAKDEDRTIDGPYFRLSVGFGGS